MYKEILPKGITIPCKNIRHLIELSHQLRITNMDLILQKHNGQNNYMFYLSINPRKIESTIHLEAEIPKTQNSLTISDNNNLDIFLRPVLQYLKYFTPTQHEDISVLKRKIYI